VRAKRVWQGAGPKGSGPSEIVRRYCTKFYWSVESWKKTLKIRAILKKVLNSP
jgi:hypothetical protein